jgi:nucleoside triphosphatase
MPHYPEPIVGAFILNKKGQLFLFQTHKWNNSYCVPGGHIEWGESIDNALLREVKEETNLIVKKKKFLCLWEFIAEEEFWKKKHMIFLNFLVETTNEMQEVKLNHEAEEYIWITPQKALSLPLEKYTKLTIEQYLLK